MKLVFMLAVENDIQKLQIMGDSMVVINWLKEAYAMENLTLKPISEEILNLKDEINEVSFLHVYREKNCLAD